MAGWLDWLQGRKRRKHTGKQDSEEEPLPQPQWFDQHVHSWNSSDSKSNPAEVVELALARGLDGVTFTEHYDTHPAETKQCIYDEREIASTITTLRRDFGDRIFIGKGIEVDFQPENLDAICAFLDEHTYDLVILSVHWVEGRPINQRRTWEKYGRSELTRLYLEAVRDAARCCVELHRKGRVFDVLGHPNLARRYSHQFFGTTHTHEHVDVIDELLHACLAAELVPEINATTLVGNQDERYPGLTLVGRWVELGGRSMTYGSDAHGPKAVGNGKGEALAVARAAGLERFTVFRERAPVPIEIPGR